MKKYSSNYKVCLAADIKKEMNDWEVVVAQLAERSLAIPEDPGSNPVIGNFY